MRRINVSIMLSLVIVSILTVSAAFAGSPAQPPGAPPYGMAVRGDAGGTKLTGVIEVSFSNLHCSAPGSFACDNAGPDLASAKSVIRLSKGTNSVKAFYVDLGTVPYTDVQYIQNLALAKFRAPILEYFFGVQQGTQSFLQIYLKSISSMSIGTIPDPVNPASTLEFSAVADLVLAIN